MVSGWERVWGAEGVDFCIASRCNCDGVAGLRGCRVTRLQGCKVALRFWKLELRMMRYIAFLSILFTFSILFSIEKNEVIIINKQFQTDSSIWSNFDTTPKKLLLKFLVDEEGNITKIKFISCTGCTKKNLKLLKKSATETIQNIPKWKTDKTNEKRVKVWYTLPIVYRFSDSDSTNIATITKAVINLIPNSKFNFSHFYTNRLICKIYK